MYRHLRRKIIDRLMISAAFVCLGLAMVPLLSILFQTLALGGGQFNMAFFTQLPRAVGESGGGIANAIQGTLIIVGLASAIGVPIGVLSGVYAAEYSESKLSPVMRFINDVLTEFPSIVIGIFAYTLIVLYFRSFSVFAGSFGLAIIMIPIVSRTTEESVKLVPATIREAALALGIARWKTILRIVLSTARVGMITGVMLAVARIAGETAPLLLTAFNSFFWFSGLDKPAASLPMYIFIFAISPFPDWQAKAWGAALVLVLIIFAISVVVRYVTRGKYHT